MIGADKSSSDRMRNHFIRAVYVRVHLMFQKVRAVRAEKSTKNFYLPQKAKPTAPARRVKLTA
jgi:hypothetical protein